MPQNVASSRRADELSDPSQIWHPHLSHDSLESDQTDEMKQSMKPPAGSVYVKKWMRTRHAIMFRLSNKIVQVNF